VPFAGKDTQCLRLARWLDAPVLSGGDILRKREDLPAHIREIFDAGKLIPIKDYLAIVTPYLGQADFEGRPLVLSSVGRYRGEEDGVLTAAEGAGHPVKAVVLLEIGEEMIWERWRKAVELMDRGYRVDDGDEATLRVRLEEFRTKTLPVIEFYRQKELLLKVDGSGSLEEVEANIWAALYDRAKR
jgi:adenylate kinase